LPFLLIAGGSTSSTVEDPNDGTPAASEKTDAEHYDSTKVTAPEAVAVDPAATMACSI